MSNIIEVAENVSKILSFENIVKCPRCGERQFSSYDKLYTSAYQVCFMCDETDEIRQENIFRILE